MDCGHGTLTLDAITLARRRRGHLPPADSILPLLIHERIAARVLDPARYVLLEAAWVDHGTHRCMGPLASQQGQLLWVLAPAGRKFQVEEDREIVPAIFYRDATENNAVVDVAEADRDVSHVVRAPPC